MKVWVKSLLHGDDDTDVLAIGVDEACADRDAIQELEAREEVDGDDPDNQEFFDLIDSGNYSSAIRWLTDHTMWKVTVSRWWEVADHNVEEKLDDTP